MRARLVFLVLLGCSGCVLDVDGLVLNDGGPAGMDGGGDAGRSDLDAGTDAGQQLDAGSDAGQPTDAGSDAGQPIDAGPRLLDVGAVCTLASQCVTGTCAGQCVPWATSVANVIVGSTLVGPDDQPWWLAWFNRTVTFGSNPVSPNPVPGANPIVSRRFSDGTEASSLILEPSLATLEAFVFTPDGGLVIAGENSLGSLGAFPVGVRNPNEDSYVARIDTGAMSVVWLTNIGGFYAERRPRIATAPSGDVFVTGWTSSAALELTACPTSSTCDGGLVPARDGGTTVWFTYVARLDGQSGVPRWVRFLRSPAHVDSRAIAYSASDDSVVVGGAFIGGLQVEDAPDGGFGPVSGVNDDDGWLLKFAGSTGAFVWGRVIGQGSNDSVQSLAIDPSGEIYVGALYSHTAPVAPLPAVTALSPIVMKVSADNQPRWGRVLQASSPVTAPRAGQFAPQNGYAQIGVLLGADGHLIVSGWSNRALTTSSVQVVTPAGGDENFLFPLSATNTFQPGRVLTFRATGGAVATPALSRNGNLFVSGTFAGTLTLPLDGGTLTKTSDAGVRDFFSASLGRWP